MKKSSLTSYAHSSSWTNLQSDGFHTRNVNVVIDTNHPLKLLGSCLSDQWFEHLDNSNRKGDDLLNERTEGAWKYARVGPRFRHQKQSSQGGSLWHFKGNLHITHAFSDGLSFVTCSQSAHWELYVAACLYEEL